MDFRVFLLDWLEFLKLLLHLVGGRVALAPDLALSGFT